MRLASSRDVHNELTQKLESITFVSHASNGSLKNRGERQARTSSLSRFDQVVKYRLDCASFMISAISH